MNTPKLLAVLALSLLAACKDAATKPAASSGSAALPDLTASLDAVRAEFNAHVAEPRFLTLLSAT